MDVWFHLRDLDGMLIHLGSLCRCVQFEGEDSSNHVNSLCQWVLQLLSLPVDVHLGSLELSHLAAPRFWVDTAATASTSPFAVALNIFSMLHG